MSMPMSLKGTILSLLYTIFVAFPSGIRKGYKYSAYLTGRAPFFFVQQTKRFTFKSGVSKDVVLAHDDKAVAIYGPPTFADRNMGACVLTADGTHAVIISERIARDEAAYAAILYHELGHIMLGHLQIGAPRRSAAEGTINEADADAFAIKELGISVDEYYTRVTEILIENCGVLERAYYTWLMQHRRSIAVERHFMPTAA